MSADPGPFTHHVVGAVHVLTLRVDDFELTRRVLEQERSVCSARRIVVDLTSIGSRLDEHLGIIRELAWNQNLMVKVTTDGGPTFLERLAGSEDSAIVSAG